jgi:hypothetical protein
MIPDISKCKPLNVVAFDPGILTGIAYFREGLLHTTEHLSLEDLSMEYVAYQHYPLDYVIIESFRIYAHKAKSLTNDPMITPKIIGKLEEWFKDYKIVYQSASMAKGFFTDKRLKEMGLYVKNKHERDAIRHSLYALYFNKEVK